MDGRISNLRSTLFWLLILLPLFGMAGVQDTMAGPASQQSRQADATLPELIYDSSEHFSSIDSANLDGLLERIGNARLVLLGEASHGTAEFYDMRARISAELIKKKGFNIIAVEADWPDATSIDHFIRGSSNQSTFDTQPFTDYPPWMWANHSVLKFARWLKNYNRHVNSADDAVGFYGLDLYNLFGSIKSVLDYLQYIDPGMAEVAHRRYGCLMQWAADPWLYNKAIHYGMHSGCANEVHAVWQDLRKKRQYYRQAGEQQLFDAVQNARLVRNGEHFYRTKFRPGVKSWNLRDQSMFDTLLAILDYRGPTSKAIVWAHNSHVGDARATDLRKRGWFSIGQLVRQTFGDNAYMIGFGTNHGTVAASKKRDGPMEIMPVAPSQENSYGYLFHNVKANNFLLPLRYPKLKTLRKNLMAERLLRGIGVTYDNEPKAELEHYYFYASLPRQFDEFIWIDETQAVKPLGTETAKDVPNVLK